MEGMRRFGNGFGNGNGNARNRRRFVLVESNQETRDALIDIFDAENVEVIPLVSRDVALHALAMGALPPFEIVVVSYCLGGDNAPEDAFFVIRHLSDMHVPAAVVYTSHDGLLPWNAPPTENWDRDRNTFFHLEALAASFYFPATAEVVTDLIYILDN